MLLAIPDSLCPLHQLVTMLMMFMSLTMLPNLIYICQNAVVRTEAKSASANTDSGMFQLLC